MAAFKNRLRALRARRNSEHTALNPCIIECQLPHEQQERLKGPAFHPFMRLPAELKLRVVQNTDIHTLKDLAASCRTMWRLWHENMEAIWSAIVRERYSLESEVVGPVESFPSFKKSENEENRT